MYVYYSTELTDEKGLIHNGNETCLDDEIHLHFILCVVEHQRLQFDIWPVAKGIFFDLMFHQASLYVCIYECR